MSMIDWNGGHPLPTKSLFYEMTYPKVRDQSICRFSLSDRDKKDDEGNDYLSLKRIYLEAEDLTEYQFAMEVFGSFPLWENLCSIAWFKPYIEQWRKELKLRIRAKSVKYMLANMEKNNRNGDMNFSALKYLAEYDIVPSDKRKTKKELLEEKKAVAEMVFQTKEVKEDMDRLGLRVIGNGD